MHKYKNSVVNQGVGRGKPSPTPLKPAQLLEKQKAWEIEVAPGHLGNPKVCPLQLRCTCTTNRLSLLTVSALPFLYSWQSGFPRVLRARSWSGSSSTDFKLMWFPVQRSASCRISGSVCCGSSHTPFGADSLHLGRRLEVLRVLPDVSQELGSKVFCGCWLFPARSLEGPKEIHVMIQVIL